MASSNQFFEAVKDQQATIAVRAGVFCMSIVVELGSKRCVCLGKKGRAVSIESWIDPSADDRRINETTDSDSTESKPTHAPKQVTLGVVGVTYAILKARKVQLNRDANDYKGGLGDFLNIMRNTEFEQHKSKDAKTSVDQYAGLFDGARKEVGKISSEESIEVRRSQYEVGTPMQV